MDAESYKYRIIQKIPEALPEYYAFWEGQVDKATDKTGNK
jgi:hypothetical protein